MDNRALGAEIRRMRRLRKWNQDDLASRIHMSKSGVGRIEKGVINKLDTLLLCLDVLGLKLVLKNKYGEETYEGSGQY